MLTRYLIALLGSLVLAHITLRAIDHIERVRALEAERVHLMQQVTAWREWWAASGAYYSYLRARHAQQSTDRLMARIRADTYSLDELERGQ